MIVPLFVGRDKSVVALEKAMEANKEIFLLAQLDPAEDDPGKDDLYDIGVTATIMQMLKAARWHRPRACRRQAKGVARRA